MRVLTTIVFLVAFIIGQSCAKIDKTLPYVSTLLVNGKSGDIVYIGVPTLSIEYDVSDDEIVVDSKIKIVENANLDSGYFYLNVRHLNAGSYSGKISVTLPDSIFQLSQPLTISIDAFDDSGNQAKQVKSIIKFR